MPTFSQRGIAELRTDLSRGNHDAVATMLPLVYDDLCAIADRTLRGERRDHTLEPTALVHEAFLRLVRQRNVRWEHRPHFIGVAVQLMHRILVDHARSRRAAKRRADGHRVSLDQAALCADRHSDNLTALDEALDRLAAIDGRQSRVVELRYFVGLTIEQSAAVLGVSPATVKREWTTAKAWLRRAICTD